MPIEKSLGLAQKLESCAKIADIYADQVDTTKERISYQELSEAIKMLHALHVGTRTIIGISVSYATE